MATEIKSGKETAAAPPEHRSDSDLVRDCLAGQEEAWTELVDKYKRLIFSVPIKYGFSREEAADIFQDVCLELLNQLKTVREPQALAKWLLMVTSHKCFHWKNRSQRIVAMDMPALEAMARELPPEALEKIAEAQQDQMLREAMASLPDRCQALLKMLFFDEPSRPYRDVAEFFGVAVGSIGFIRQRCLEHLRKKIETRQSPW